MASLFRSAAPKLSTPQPTAAPPATTSDGSPAKGVFDRYLAPSPAGSPSSTPRPPTEKRETQAQKKVRGLVEKFELKAKSLGTTNGTGGIKSSSSSKSLSSEAAGSPSAEEPTVVKKEEDASEVADDKVKSESAEPASAPAPTSSAVASPKPHHKGASTPFIPLATTTSVPSPSASPRPASPLLPPPESDLPVITSLSSQHLEPPSEASPSILSPIGEMANPLAATMYDQIKSVAAVLSGTHEMTPEQAAPRPPRQPSPEPEDEPEPVTKADVKKEEQEVEVPKPKEDDKSTLSTPTTSQSQESVGESTATAPSSSTSEAATPAAVEVKKEETEEPIVKKEENKEETVPVKKEDVEAEDVKPDVSAVKTEEDTTPQAPLKLTHRHTLFFSDTSPNKKASGSSSAAYEHGLQPLFTSGTVQEFCGSWKALRTHLKTTTNGDDGVSRTPEVFRGVWTGQAC